MLLWPPDGKNWLIGKDPDSGKDWRREKKGMREDEMVGWHHQLYGHEFEQAPGVGDGRGGLVCCSPWGRKESDKTEQLNWTELNSFLLSWPFTTLVCGKHFKGHPRAQAGYWRSRHLVWIEGKKLFRKEGSYSEVSHNTSHSQVKT